MGQRSKLDPRKEKQGLNIAAKIATRRFQATWTWRLTKRLTIPKEWQVHKRQANQADPSLCNNRKNL